MIELIWITIAALGVWNVYVEVKLRTHSTERSILDIQSVERWEAHGESHESIDGMFKVSADAMQRMDDQIKVLDAALAELQAAPIMMHPGFRESMYQWMRERDKLESDPEFIIRSQGGDRGHNRPDGV